MADRKLTLLELHMHGDAQFGPGHISTGEDEPAGSSETDDEESDDDGSGDVEVDSGGGLGGAIAALVVLAVVGIAVKKLLGGDDPDVDLEE